MSRGSKPCRRGILAAAALLLVFLMLAYPLLPAFSSASNSHRLLQRQKQRHWTTASQHRRAMRRMQVDAENSQETKDKGPGTKDQE